MHGIDSLTILSNFKMQLGSIRAAASELCNNLPGFYILPFLHQNLAVVGVSTEIVLVVIDDNQITVTQQSTARVYHVTTGGGFYSIPRISSNINTFIDFSGR